MEANSQKMNMSWWLNFLNYPYTEKVYGTNHIDWLKGRCLKLTEVYKMNLSYKNRLIIRPTCNKPWESGMEIKSFSFKFPCH